MILNLNSKVLIIFFGFSFLACSDDAATAYQVSGKVTSENGNTEDVVVQIDNKENFRTTTNTAGEFVISGVSLGDHTLELFKQYDGDIYSQKTVEIQVNQNVNLDVLTLPSPLILELPNTVTENSIQLQWSMADAADFYEYKVYVHDNQGLDELTGELVYVGTSISDVVFEHTDLLPDKEYFYRVFLRDQFGQIGGSNIVSATTLEGVLIRDGGFEIPNSNTLHWDIRDSLLNEVTTQTSAEGTSCFYNQLALLDNNFVPATSMETTYLINVEAGRTYNLSAFARVQGEHTEGTTNVWVYIKQGNTGIVFMDFDFESNNSNGIGYIEDTGWVQRSKVFQVNSNIPVRIHMATGFQNTWIDGLTLEPQ